jgi:hypothetical protein
MGQGLSFFALRVALCAGLRPALCGHHLRKKRSEKRLLLDSGAPASGRLTARLGGVKPRLRRGMQSPEPRSLRSRGYRKVIQPF